jgi:uncharacterized DUF497 family protein
MRFKGIIWSREVIDKLSRKHGVAAEEVEEVLGAVRRFRTIEKGHVKGEDLYGAMGQTDSGRYLIVYFIRKLSDEALVVSARDADRRERKAYEKK